MFANQFNMPSLDSESELIVLNFFFFFKLKGPKVDERYGMEGVVWALG